MGNILGLKKEGKRLPLYKKGGGQEKREGRKRSPESVKKKCE